MSVSDALIRASGVVLDTWHRHQTPRRAIQGFLQCSILSPGFLASGADDVTPRDKLSTAPALLCELSPPPTPEIAEPAGSALKLFKFPASTCLISKEARGMSPVEVLFLPKTLRQGRAGGFTMHYHLGITFYSLGLAKCCQESCEELCWRRRQKSGVGL